LITYQPSLLPWGAAAHTAAPIPPGLPRKGSGQSYLHELARDIAGVTAILCSSVSVADITDCTTNPADLLSIIVLRQNKNEKLFHKKQASFSKHAEQNAGLGGDVPLQFSSDNCEILLVLKFKEKRPRLKHLKS
jgi:hypothetical protein